MKNLSPEFRSHIEGEVTTLCNCWRITRTDDIELGFTDHDRIVAFDDLVFQPSSGFDATQMEEGVGLTPNNHEVVGALMSDAITEKDIMARKYDGAQIRHYVVNWSDPSQNTLMQTYLFGEITREDGIFRAELKSLVSILDQTRLRRFEKRCNADLGDHHCGIDLEGQYKREVLVSRVIAADTFEVHGIDSFSAGWFTAGKATFESGQNIGQRSEIVSHSVENDGNVRVVISLWSQPVEPVVAGDALTVLPGCDKLFSTCMAKFENALNFRGFPHMPGSDFAMSYASNSEKMDGGPLVR